MAVTESDWMDAARQAFAYIFQEHQRYRSPTHCRQQKGIDRKTQLE